MQKNGTEIVVTGTIHGKQELLNFTSALAKSTLFKRQTKTALINHQKNTFNVTLYINISAEKLIEPAFTTGPLHHWGKMFTVKEEIS